jgi:myo-inositol-1-phosphate synthase
MLKVSSRNHLNTISTLLIKNVYQAPLTKPGTDVINSLNRQRQALEAFLRACLSLQPASDLINFTSI